jgi:hypothetical protein
MYRQNDKQWSRLRWYHPELEAAVISLTEIAHKSRNALIGTSTDDSTLGQSGCWHVSVASMLSHFGVTYQKQEFTPSTLLEALREEQLGTLSGYVGRPFIDPISIVTKSKVCLHQYDDFGPKGVSLTNNNLQAMLANVDGKNCCAIANVRSHEYLGRKDSHYVLIYGQDSSDYVMHDPSQVENKQLFKYYKRVFQLSLYRQKCA